MPRARSRSSVMASLAPRWAASTSSRARSRSACAVPSTVPPSFSRGQAQLHGDGDHLGLRPVVQVPLDPAQPRGRVVHCVGPGLLQLTHPPRKRAVVDSQVPVADRELQRRQHQEERCPGDRLRREGTSHKRNEAGADQDKTSANAHARQEAQAAVLP